MEPHVCGAEDWTRRRTTFRCSSPHLLNNSCEGAAKKTTPGDQRSKAEGGSRSDGCGVTNGMEARARGDYDDSGDGRGAGKATVASARAEGWQLVPTAAAAACLTQRFKNFILRSAVARVTSLWRISGGTARV